jgi:hypothetical protein
MEQSELGTPMKPGPAGGRFKKARHKMELKKLAPLFALRPFAAP